MNILISVNENFLSHVRTMLFSLKCNVSEKVDVYLLNHRLKDSQVADLKLFLKSKCDFELHEIDVKNTKLDSLPTTAELSIETYYRLLSQFLLPKDLDRILWLDADIVILKNIEKFYHQDFNGNYYVVCPDRNCESGNVINAKKRLGIPMEHCYFNAGVMLMNIQLLRKNTTIEEIINVCEEKKNDLWCLDQDLMNYYYCGKLSYCDWKKYNYQLTHIDNIPKNEIDEIAILHYSGPYKPWNANGLNKLSHFYWKYRNKSGDVSSFIILKFKRLGFLISTNYIRIKKKHIPNKIAKKILGESLYEKVKRIKK